MHSDRKTRLPETTHELSKISCAYIPTFRLVKYQINKTVQGFLEVLLLQQNLRSFLTRTSQFPENL